MLFFCFYCGCTYSYLQQTELSAFYDAEINSIAEPFSKIDSLLKVVDKTGTATSIKVVSSKTKKILYEHNPHLLFHPASTLKIITTAAVLNALPDSFTLQTTIYVDSLFFGQASVPYLYIKGFGNPCLQVQHIESLAVQVANCGINNISTAIVADNSYFDSLYWGEGWMWDDAGDPDAPVISSLSVNNNTIEISIVPSLNDGSPTMVCLSPSVGIYSVINNSISVKQNNNRNRIQWNQFPYTKELIVDGFIHTNAPIINKIVSVPYPELLAAEILRNSLRTTIANVPHYSIHGLTPSNAVAIATNHYPLDSVISYTLKYSNNLAAECLLKLLGAISDTQPGSTQKGLTYVFKFLDSLGIDTSKIKIVDGSGVSRYNLLSADALTGFLISLMNKPLLFNKIYQMLPTPGSDGTLKQRMKNLPQPDKVRAKTGTLNGVSTLAGYIHTNDDVLAFTLMMQHFTGNQQYYRTIQDSIVAILSTINE